MIFIEEIILATNACPEHYSTSSSLMRIWSPLLTDGDDLLVARYFQTQQTRIDQIQSELDVASKELESYIEEHSGDDDLLSDALIDKDKVTSASIKARLKLATDPDEKAALKQAQKLFDAEAEAKKSLK